MTAIRFRPDSISIQGPAGDVVTESGVECIATTTLPYLLCRSIIMSVIGKKLPFGYLTISLI